MLAEPKNQLPPSSRFVALVVSTYMDANGENAWPSLSTIADNTGLSRRRVMEILNDIEASGWLVRERPPEEESQRNYTTTKYSCSYPPSALFRTTPSAAGRSRQSDESLSGRATDRTDLGRPAAPNQPQEHSSTTAGVADMRDRAGDDIDDVTSVIPAGALAALAGTEWTEREIGDARDLIWSECGLDIDYLAVLRKLAKRRRPIENLVAYVRTLASKDPDKLRALAGTGTYAKKSRESCSDCNLGWLPNDAQEMRPCPKCRPAAAAAAASSAAAATELIRQAS